MDAVTDVTTKVFRAIDIARTECYYKREISHTLHYIKWQLINRVAKSKSDVKRRSRVYGGVFRIQVTHCGK